MKKAFLVSFSPMTRIVMDVEDSENLTEDEAQQICIAAREQMINNGIEDYLSLDNIDEIKEDEELPYPQNFDK